MNPNDRANKVQEPAPSVRLRASIWMRLNILLLFFVGGDVHLYGVRLCVANNLLADDIPGRNYSSSSLLVILDPMVH